MLFWCFVILFIVSVICVVITMDEYCGEDPLMAVICSIFAVVVVISLIDFVFDHGCKDAMVAEYQAKRDALVWQFENDVYDNDNDLGKRELMEDIRIFNEDIARKKITQDNFWIGIYIPDIYDQIEMIDLNAIHGGNT